MLRSPVKYFIVVQKNISSKHTRQAHGQQQCPYVEVLPSVSWLAVNAILVAGGPSISLVIPCQPAQWSVRCENWWLPEKRTQSQKSCLLARYCRWNTVVYISELGRFYDVCGVQKYKCNCVLFRRRKGVAPPPLQFVKSVDEKEPQQQSAGGIVFI